VRRVVGQEHHKKGKTANPFPVFLFLFFFPYPLFQAEQFSFRFDGTGHGLRDSINTHHWIFSFCNRGTYLKRSFRLVNVRQNLNLIIN
jgi:hypothetical protein